MKDIRNRPPNEMRGGTLKEIFDQNIDPESITKIASFMGDKHVRMNGEYFKERLIGALDAYLNAEYEMAYYRSEKEENKVYSRD